MKNIAIIGVGKIASKYLLGLEKSFFNLVCLIDINKSPSGHHYFSSYPLYQSLDDALKHHQIDYVLISTPPHTHEKLVKTALNFNLNVLVEKLITLNLESFNELTRIASNMGLKLITLYHWQYGDEIKFLKPYFNNNLKQVNINVFDPYCNNDQVDIDYLKMGGALIDSLPNVLSYLSLFINLKDLNFKGREDFLNNNQIVKTKLIYNYNNILINIKVDWTKNKNLKETKLQYIDGTSVYINHSIPLIETSNKPINLSNENRLEKHYLNLLTTNFDNYNYQNMNLIHQLIFKQIK